MILIVVVILLAAMMSGCLNQDADSDTSGTGSNSGFSASLGNENDNENNNENNENSNNADGTGNTGTNSGAGTSNTASSTSSLPDVVTATNSGGGGSSSSKSNIWLASVSNPFIGTWISDPDESGSVLTFTGYSDGTFDYEMSNLPDDYSFMSEGSGAYLVRKDFDGTNVMVSYFGFDSEEASGLVKSNTFEVINNNLIKVTEFTIEYTGEDSSEKDFGETTYFRRSGPAVRSDYVDTEMMNIFAMYSDSEAGGYGWGADAAESDEGMKEILLEILGRDYYASVWKFNYDGTVDCSFLDLMLLMAALEGEELGEGENSDAVYPFSYTVYDADPEDGGIYDENDRIIIYTEDPGQGIELMVYAFNFDETDSSMTFDWCEIIGGFAVPTGAEMLFWPYPTVNPKVILKENNEAGLTFLSIPDSDEWAAQTATSKENGIIWGHDAAVSEGSSSHPVIGYPNQMPSGSYNSGFEFSIETNAEDNAEYRPAIGFSAFADFTPENLGEDKYNALVSKLEALDDEYYYYGWYLPGADVLTDLGIHIYGKTCGITNDITDGVSFGIYDIGAETDTDMLLLNYGAVMVDDENDHEGTELYLSEENELVWSDGVQDGFITAEWWIVLDPLYAGGTGTPVDPFQIETAKQLDNVRLNLDRHFILTDNVDLIDLPDYENWEPIGAYVPASEEDAEAPSLDDAFIGTFDGNGHIVSNLVVNQPEGAAVGLFGCVAGTTTKIIEFEGMHGRGCMNKAINALEALDGVQSVDVVLNRAMLILNEDYEIPDDELKEIADNICNFNWKSTETFDGPAIYDLMIEDADVTGFCLVGSVVGYAVDCTMDNVDLIEIIGTNTISGYAMVGGIVGGSVSSDMTGCDAAADIIVLNEEAMLIKLIDEFGSAPGTVGILGGGLESSSLINCTATGTVSAVSDNVYGISGLAGCAFDSLLVDSCIAADVTITAAGSSNKMIGGLLGFTGTYDEEKPTVISNCEVDAEIIVNSNTAIVGGIVGSGYFMEEEAFRAFLDSMELSEEEYEMYYEEYSFRLTPSLFEIDNCVTAGSITGGSEYVGSIVGRADNLEEKDVADSSSTMTWNTDWILNKIGRSSE
ncbi:hypothetical protein MmiAt1_10490 [Methanimicrococcus sp. At1]|uniref:GLUG domain-containing protein n=2 Tax=Methanimicrococcus hacksteinii TaxID=3028293 RepID=A0ABU3VPX5_9EURY|nr:hypothetical protein [Methanimicrococcus sp. At1]